MSRASEWVARHRDAGERPVFTVTIVTGARVEDDGRLFVSGCFEPEKALALARWILTTFEETP